MKNTGRRWTQKECEELKKLWDKMSKEELEKHFDRTMQGIKYKAYKLELGYKNKDGVTCTERDIKLKKKNKKWSEEDISYLKEKWGKTSIQRLAKMLERSESSVYNRARILNLDSFKANSDFFSISELSIAFSTPGAGTYPNNLKRWTKGGLKIEERLIGNNYMRVARKDEFWKFAYKNKELFDFGKLERFVLDKEPDWVEAERIKAKRERRAHPNRSKTWSKREINLLISKVKSRRFTYEEIAKDFGRTVPGIQAKLIKLKILDRPLTRRIEE